MIVKKSVLYPIAIVLISTALLFNLTNIGVYSSHDSQVHIARLAQVYESLGEGIFPARWLGSWNFGFGYPAFVFIYSLPYYGGALLKFSGLDFQQIFKILMFLSLSLSGITFFYLAKKYVRPLAAFLGALFYISAPYRFADIYERGALGESLAFILIPLLFLTLANAQNRKFINFLFISFVTFAHLTTHAITFVMFLPLVILFAIFTYKKEPRNYFFVMVAIIFGFLLASFQWIPMMFEQKFADLENTYSQLFNGHFITAFQLLRIPKEGINTGTGIQLGTTQLVICLASAMHVIGSVLIKRKIHKTIVLLLLISIIASYLAIDFSKFIWNTITPLQSILFPWRFLIITTFLTSLLGSFLLDTISNKKIIRILLPVLIALAIFPSRHYIKANGWHSFDDEFYKNYKDPYKLDYYYIPKGAVKNTNELGLKQISFITGDGEISNVQKTNNKLSARVIADKKAKIQLHTFYFPGWELFINGQKSSIEKSQPHLEGIMITSLEKGNHEILLTFAKTPLRKSADLISFLSWVLLLLIVVIRKYKHSLFHNRIFQKQ